MLFDQSYSRILDKIDIENKTASQITSKKRVDVRLWNQVALREAIINAIVHNDYAREVPPKFEIFSDRIEITSAGSLPEDLSEEEFFQGFSVPRNQEIMRIFKDLDLVGHLGSGIPRILEYYSKNCFHFLENFLRMVFLASEAGTPQVQSLLSVLQGGQNRQELQEKLGLSDRENFRTNYLQPAVEKGLIENDHSRQTK